MKKIIEDMDTVKFLKKTRAVDYQNGKYNIDCLIRDNFKTTWRLINEYISFLSENVQFLSLKRDNRHRLIIEVIKNFNEIHDLVNYTYTEIVGSNVKHLMENEYELSVLNNYLKTAYKQILARIPNSEKAYYKKFFHKN